MIYFKKYILFILYISNNCSSFSQKSLDNLNEKFKQNELQKQLNKELDNQLFKLAGKFKAVNLEELKKTTYNDNYINLPVGPNFSKTAKIPGRQVPSSILDKNLYYGICYDIISCLHFFIPELDFNLYFGFLRLDDIDSFLDELYSISSLKYMSYKEEIKSLRQKYYNDNKEYEGMNPKSLDSDNCKKFDRRTCYIFKLIVFLHKFQKKYYPSINEDHRVKSDSFEYDLSMVNILFKDKKYSLIVKRIILSFFQFLDDYSNEIKNISFSCFENFIKVYYDVDDNNKLTPLFSNFKFSDSERSEIYDSLLILMKNFLINSLKGIFIPHTSYNYFISLQYFNILFENEECQFNGEIEKSLHEDKKLNCIKDEEHFNFGKYFISKILGKMKTSKTIRTFFPNWHKDYIDAFECESDYSFSENEDL